jgi:hypothetical protein
MAACTDDGSGDVQTKSQAEAEAAVRAQADQVAAQVGAEPAGPGLSAAPCTGRRGEDGDDVYFVQGTYQLPLDAAQHAATAAKVRDAWKGAGWTIDDDRTAGPKSILTGTSPEGYNVTLESTVPPQAFALIVHSPCFRRPA